MNLIILLVIPLLVKAKKTKCPTECICKGQDTVCQGIQSTKDFTKILKQIPQSTVTLTFKRCDIGQTLNKDTVTSLKNLKNVKRLYILNSGLREIEPGAIQLPNLKSLYLVDNQIRSINANTFATTPQLRELVLKGNELTNIPEGTFAKIQKLKYLNLQKNKLNSLEAVSLSELDQLRTLSLSSNRIIDIEMNSFSKQTKLSKLDLDYNRLPKVPDFTGLKSLKLLNLAGNELTELPSPAFFIFQDSLRTLDISDNKISKISWSAVQDLTNLVQFNMTNNKIQDLPNRFATSLDLLDAIDNPIICDCNIAPFVLWVSDMKRPGLADNVQCSEPKYHKDKILSELSIEKIQQECTKTEAAMTTTPAPVLDEDLHAGGISTTNVELIVDLSGGSNKTNTKPVSASKIIEITDPKHGRSNTEICLKEGKTRCTCLDFIFQINCAHKDLEKIPTAFSKTIRLFDLRNNYSMSFFKTKVLFQSDHNNQTKLD